MKKYIVSVASCLFALCMQSCFQDMDHPAFDYPESTGEVPTTPLKMYLPFDEEDIRDKGEWGFLVADNGNAKFVEIYIFVHYYRSGCTSFLHSIWFN